MKAASGWMPVVTFGTQTTNGACGCTHFNPVVIGNAKGLGPFLVNP